MQQFTCVECGLDWQRPTVRGRTPKLCPECREAARRRSRTYSRNCAGCGKPGVRSDGSYCGRACATAHKKRPHRKPKQLELAFPHPASELGPLRRALEEGDKEGVIAVLKVDTVETDDGCWEWQRRVQDGYATVKVAGKTKSVHRLVAEARYGPLGREPVHHRCANARCVNPDHLQPVTHRENVAEMMARNYYVTRIAELEAALRDVDKDHPALRRISSAA